MARPVYSVSFVFENLSSGAQQTGPLPLAGFVFVVRDIQVNTDESDAGNLATFFGFHPATSTVFDLINWNVPGPANSDRHWQGRMVLPLDHSFIFQAVTGSWSAAISGYQLTSP